MNLLKDLNLIEFIKTTESKILKVLGLTCYKRITTPEYKKYYLFGLKICTKRVAYPLLRYDTEEIVNRISLNTQRAISTAILHQKTFSEYKNKHAGETVVLVGAGPTVTKFEPIPNAKYVGLNRAYLYDKVKFDYLFTIDRAGLDTGEESFYEGFINYDCIKFIGDQNLGIGYQIPQHLQGLDNPSVRHYKTTANYLPEIFHLDIDTCALRNSCSCSIQAMQFILFTNPKKVYVVGVDCTCSKKEHFIGSAYDNLKKRNEDLRENDLNHIQSWKELKEFADTYYPETEIIVVNPVGLKGIFEEYYTKSF